MKKVIGILVLMLLGTTVFGQIDYFKKQSVVINKDGDFIQKDNIPPQHYWFEANNKKYVLAYDADEDDWKKNIGITTKNKVTRSLILYRFDGVNNWVRASNVVQVDYKVGEPHVDCGTHIIYGTNSSKIIKKGLGNGKIEIHESGCVVMTITNNYHKPDKVYNFSQSTKTYSYNGQQVDERDTYTKDYDYNAVVIFVPNGDNTYTATRFEPKNKRTDNFSRDLKITKVDDKLMIDVNTNVENYATLLFKIQPDNTVDVLTSGKLNLVKKL